MRRHLSPDGGKSDVGVGAAMALTAAAASVAFGSPAALDGVILLLSVLVATRLSGHTAGYAATLTGAAYCLARIAVSGAMEPRSVDTADATALVLLGAIGTGIAAWVGPQQLAVPVRPGDPARLKEEFLATVSHELRTPLNAILGWTAVLRTPTPSAPLQVDRGLEVIERNARRQLALIEELLAAAEPDLSPEHWQPLEIHQTLGGLLDELAPLATTRGVTMVTDGPGPGAPAPEPIWVRGDGASLRLALRHVLDNAVKYTPAGGDVQTRIRQCGDQAFIFISDTGAGLDAGQVEHAFEPFRQIDGTAARRFGGLGLGLTIARKVIEQHGGHVDLRSDGPSGGATVLVTLPTAVP